MMKTTTISAILLAVAVLATGCKKADDPSMGPAQEAGKALDNAGAEVRQESREAAAATEHAADRAGDKMREAGAEVRQETREAGAEVRQESRDAAQNVREGADKATDATGRALERAGEKMQDKK
jgi:hypothetical protein